MKITKIYEPIVYKFVHAKCCEFEANEDEFEWRSSMNNRYAFVKCPNCGYEFICEPEEKKEEDYPQPNEICNCIHDCKNCSCKCLFRKEKYNPY